MSAFAKAALWAGRKMAGWGGGVTLDTTDPRLAQYFGGFGTHAGKSVNETTAMQVSTVWACVRILAEGVGQLPWHIFEKEKDGNLKRVDHDLGDVLINAPNADMTSNEYREAVMANLGLHGNGPSFIERNASGTRVNSLYPIRACDCRARRRVDGQLVDAATYSGGELVYQVNDRGRWETVPKERIWASRIFSLNGVVGLSPIGYARESIGFASALEEFGSRIFSQGLHAGVIFKYPTWMPDEKRTLMEDKINRQWTGLMRTGKPFIAEGGIEPTPGIIPPKDIEFLGLRGYGVDDICRFYLVPPHRVARLERATNNNIEQLSLEFVMYTLLPYIVKIERSADRWLFNARDRGRFVVRFNYDGLLRADSEGRSKLESVWLQNGVVNRNQVRALENMPRSDAPGMDDYSVQSNMISVEDLKLVAEAMRAKASPPAAPAPAEKSAPVQIQLKSMDEATERSAEALSGVKEGLSGLKVQVAELARATDALVQANVTIAQETARNAKRLAGTQDAIERSLSELGAERELVFDGSGQIVGSRVKH